MKKSLVTEPVYSDLNLVKANMSDTVKSAKYTAIFERIHGRASHY
jgi:hypothetical protein|tara:strand:- start:351 stop:485 length:135 start_codon:yes stop_codon:yes gene_type:complete